MVAKMTSDPPGGDDLLTTQQVLDLLGISKPSLYSLINDGIIAPLPTNPALKRPRRLFFKREDVERVKREGRKPRA